MKKIVVGGAAFAAVLGNCLMGVPAVAADLPVETVYVARPAAVGLLNWTGSSNFSVTGLGTNNLSNFQGGGAIGGGVEFAVASDWTVRAEYLYLQSTTISNTPFAARPDVTVNTRIRDNVFRVGVSYMFF